MKPTNWTFPILSEPFRRLAAFPTERLHNLVYGLLYPAFLGSLIYNYVDQRQSMRLEATLVLIFLLLLFALDFVYSLAKVVMENYSIAQFAIDLIVVVLLYIAAKSIPGERLFIGFAPWGALALSRAAAALWEEYQYQRLRAAAVLDRSRRHANSDWILTFCYLIVGQIGWNSDEKTSAYSLLIAPLFLDVFVYLYNMSKPGRKRHVEHM
jgi:hypothetical protein